MPHLSGRGRGAVDQLRVLSRDATGADHLAQRALAVLQGAVPFDEGAVFALDAGSLVFTRLLAYRGPQPREYAAWLRDVYLVAPEVGALHVPTLLRHGGVVAMHERADRWLRSPPPAPDPVLARAWREWDSPAGGVVRYGLSVRRQWVGLIQLSRLDHGDGFRPSELEVLDRAVPPFARGLAERLRPRRAAGGPPPPPPGHLIFDERRRPVMVSACAQQWLTLLPDDVARVLEVPGPVAVPVGVQSVVGMLTGSDAITARLTMTAVDGTRVVVRGERALHIDASVGPTTAYSLTVAAAPVLSGGNPIASTQWMVAEGVAAGHNDREIAERLHLSVHTVHERVAALHDLCGTRSRPQLVAALAQTVAVSR